MLSISIVITGLATALVGAIPTFANIGNASILFLLGCRIAQSIAIGSEFLNSSSYLVESGEALQRGFRGCWSSVGVKVGTLVACLFAELAHHITITHPGYENMWRIPFLLATLTMGIGFIIRLRMPESLAYVLYYASRPKPTTRVLCQQTIYFIKHYPFLFRYAFFASFLSIASSFFFYLYMPLHAMHEGHFTHTSITVSTLVSLAATALLIPLFGYMSDKQDRLNLLTFSTAGLLMLSYPFMLAVNQGNISQFFIMQLLISIPCAGYYSVCSVILTELFPLQIRCTALSITFSIASSIAAGAPPVLADYLARVTNSPNSPCLIIMTIAATMLYNIKKLTQHYRLDRNEYRSVGLFEAEPIFNIQYKAAEE